MNAAQTTLPRWPDRRSGGRRQVASTREDALLRYGGTILIRAGRPRGLFFGNGATLNEEWAMGRTTNPSVGPDGRDDGREKPSRVAECVAALYIALVLMTPWLLRDVSWLTPPSHGAEIQVVNQATAAAAAPADRHPSRPSR